MKEVLFLACIAGSVVEYWRWVAGEGFGLGRANVPLILASQARYLLIFALGFALKWGSAVVLGWLFGWLLALAALLIGALLSRVVVRALCRQDIKQAARIQEELAKRQG